MICLRLLIFVVVIGLRIVVGFVGCFDLNCCCLLRRLFVSVLFPYNLVFVFVVMGLILH